MCAQIPQTTNSIEDINKQLEELEYSWFVLFRKSALLQSRITMEIDYLFGPTITTILRPFSKRSFYDAEKQVQKLSPAQLTNFKVLVDLYQDNMKAIDLYEMNEKLGRNESYISVLKKNFTWNTESRSNRGNLAFSHLIEKEYKFVKRPRKTKTGFVSFERRVAVYTPQGFFKNIAELFHNWISAAEDFRDYWKLREEKYELTKKIYGLEDQRRDLEIAQAPKDRNKLLLPVDFGPLHKEILNKEYSSIQEVKPKAENNLELVKKMKASIEVDDFNNGEHLPHDEFIKTIEKSSKILLSNLKRTRKYVDDLNAELKRNVLSDVEGRIFTYKNVFSK